MPTYSYTCNACGSTFDVRATITEKQRGLKVTCPQCAAQDVRQILRDVPILIRGDGGGGAGGCCDPSSGCCGPSPQRKSR